MTGAMTATSVIVFTLLVAVSASCPSGFTRLHNACYAIPQQEASWFGALAMCNAYGGYLAGIDSLEEQFFVAGLAGRVSGISRNLWIGGHDAMTEGTWRWVRNDRLIRYTNWSAGEPTNSTRENCLSMLSANAYQWNDFNCDAICHFVCRYDLTTMISKHGFIRDFCSYKFTGYTSIRRESSRVLNQGTSGFWPKYVFQ